MTILNDFHEINTFVEYYHGKCNTDICKNVHVTLLQIMHILTIIVSTGD